MPEPESNRPAGCRFWTAKDVMVWIEAHVDPGKVGEDTPEESARWWKANVDAESYSEMSSRDLAEFCLNGMTPNTLDDVTDEVQAPHLGETVETTTDLDDYVESQLRKFFGVDR